MLKKFFMGRLKEASTYRGLLVILGMFGVSLDPGKADAIVAACVALYGVMAVFLPNTFGQPEPVKTEHPKDIVSEEMELPQKWDGKAPGQFP